MKKNSTKLKKMKARFNLKLELCYDFPNCNCSGHYVWETIKQTKECDKK